jgi:hypothetical protein
MKKVLGAVAVAAALAACGILKTTINYADGSAGKDDPVGLKGRPLTVSLLSKGAPQLQKTLTDQPFGGANATFGDIDISQVPAGVSLSEWGFSVPLTIPAAGAALSGTDCPSSIAITGASASLTVKNQSGGAGVPIGVTFSPNAMTLTESSTDCVYTAPAQPLVLTAKIAGADLSNALAIITTGGTNQVDGKFSLTYDDALAGRTLNLAFGGGTGYVIAGL